MDKQHLELLIFVSVLGIQYHPRNDVHPDSDPQIIARCIRVTELASLAFYNHFVIGADSITF